MTTTVVVKFPVPDGDWGKRSAWDVLFTASPLVDMASIDTTFVPWLVLSGTYVLHHPFDPQTFMKQMIGERVNYTLLVPAVANMIVKHPLVDQFDLSSVRTITLGSAPPSLFTMQEFKRRWNIEIGNIWGQNEGTAIISSPRDVPDLAKRVDHLPHFGKPGVKWSVPVEGIRTKLVDPDKDIIIRGGYNISSQELEN